MALPTARLPDPTARPANRPGRPPGPPARSGQRSGHAAQFRALFDALDAGAPAPVTLVDAYSTLELVAAIYASASGRAPAATS